MRDVGENVGIRVTTLASKDRPRRTRTDDPKMKSRASGVAFLHGKRQRLRDVHRKAASRHLPQARPLSISEARVQDQARCRALSGQHGGRQESRRVRRSVEVSGAAGGVARQLDGGQVGLAAHTIVEVDGVQLDSQPKDYEARSIPVPASLLAELKTHVNGKEAGSPAFAAARGGWLRGRVFRHGWFDEAAEMIGQDGLTPHEMRHTAASLAISAGANVKVVQRIMGHASAAVTLDVYSDLFDSDLDTVSAALDVAIGQLRRSRGAAVPTEPPRAANSSLSQPA